MDAPFDDTGSAGQGLATRVWADFLSVLETLPPPTRAVYLMHAMFDASFEDIERTTGVRREICGQHIARARRAVREFARGGNDSKRDQDR
jgi:DNA-directed RNA polymerase specialized sigma24 family protein